MLVNYADLNELEVIEENYDDNDPLNEPTRLSTVQEDDLANEVTALPFSETTDSL